MLTLDLVRHDVHAVLSDGTCLQTLDVVRPGVTVLVKFSFNIKKLRIFKSKTWEWLGPLCLSVPSIQTQAGTVLSGNAQVGLELL